jgi:hypothetical protein
LQKKLLSFFCCLGLLLIPFAFKRENLKEWLLVFFVKGYITNFIGHFAVKGKQVSYPIRFLPKFFKINIVFDYLLFPILCVFYNRTSFFSTPITTIFQALLYSMPMTILEVILEKYTDLIKYKNSWNWMITYLTLAITFLFVRLFMFITRKLHIETDRSC